MSQCKPFCTSLIFSAAKHVISKEGLAHETLLAIYTLWYKEFLTKVSYCKWKEAFIGTTNAEIYSSRKELVALVSIVGVQGMAFMTERATGWILSLMTNIKEVLVSNDNSLNAIVYDAHDIAIIHKLKGKLTSFQLHRRQRLYEENCSHGKLLIIS